MVGRALPIDHPRQQSRVTRHEIHRVRPHDGPVTGRPYRLCQSAARARLAHRGESTRLDGFRIRRCGQPDHQAHQPARPRRVRVMPMCRSRLIAPGSRPGVRQSQPTGKGPPSCVASVLFLDVDCGSARVAHDPNVRHPTTALLVHPAAPAESAAGVPALGGAIPPIIVVLLQPLRWIGIDWPDRIVRRLGIDVRQRGGRWQQGSGHEEARRKKS